MKTTVITYFPLLLGDKKDKVNFGDLKSIAHIMAYYLHQRIKGNAPVQICMHW